MRFSRYNDIQRRELRRRVAEVFKTSSLRIFAWLKMFFILYEQVSLFVPKKGRVLDLGCGYGFLSIFLALDSAERQVLGIDPSQQRIKAIGLSVLALPENVVFKNAEIETLKSAQFDCVIMEQALHHIPKSQQQDVLHSIHKLLRDGGNFILRENNKRWSFKYILVNLPMEYLLWVNEEKGNFRTNSELKAMLRKANFSCEIVQAPWYYLIDMSMFVCQKQTRNETPDGLAS